MLLYVIRLGFRLILLEFWNGIPILLVENSKKILHIHIGYWIYDAASIFMIGDRRSTISREAGYRINHINHSTSKYKKPEKKLKEKNT